MSTESPARPKKSWRKRIGIAFCVMIGLILLSGLISYEIPLMFLYLLIFVLSGLIPAIGLCVGGWILFLARITQEIEFDPWSISLGLGAFVALVFGVHRAIHRFLPGRKWTLSQTFRCVLGVIASFVAGICLLGVGHESSWLVRSEKPVMLPMDTWYERIASRRSNNNLETIGQAVTDHTQQMVAPLVGGTFQEDGEAGHGWLAALLPYLYQQPIYDEIDFSVPWYAKKNRQPYSQRIAGFESLDDWRKKESFADGYARASVAANDKVLNANFGLRGREITDGVTHTILAGEVKQNRRPWGDVANWRDVDLGINQSPDGFGAPDLLPDKLDMFEFPSESELRQKTKRGATFLMADGSVRFLNEDIDPKVLHALATPNSKDATQ